MSLRTSLPLACLTDEELARVTAAGGPELTFQLAGQPGQPIQGTVGLTCQGPRGSVTGGFTAGPQGWGLTLGAGLHPNRNVSLEGQFRTDGRNHEWTVQGRIRFLHA